MNRKKWITIIVLIAVIGILAACSKPTEKTDQVQYSYFPLKVDNQWLFDTNIADQIQKDILFKVTSKENVGEVECFVYESFVDGKSVQKEYYNFSEGALLAHKRESQGGRLIAVLDPPEPMLKFPLKADKEWTWSGKIQGDITGDFEFKVLGEEEVEVPAGKFTAMKVEMSGKASDGSSASSVRWFVKDLGMVKEESQVGKLTVVGNLKGAKVDGKVTGEDPSAMMEETESETGTPAEEPGPVEETTEDTPETE